MTKATTWLMPWPASRASRRGSKTEHQLWGGLGVSGPPHNMNCPAALKTNEKKLGGPT